MSMKLPHLAAWLHELGRTPIALPGETHITPHIEASSSESVIEVEALSTSVPTLVAMQHSLIIICFAPRYENNRDYC